MLLKPRLKCAASIDSSGIVLTGGAADGYEAPESGASFQYLLEDAAGNWEIGYAPNAEPRQTISNSAAGPFPNSIGSLTLSVVAIPAMYANHAPGAGNSAPLAPDVSLSALESVALGSGAQIGDNSTYSVAVGAAATVSANAQDSTAVGYSAYANKPRNTAVGRNAVASSFAEGGTALGASSYAANGGEVALGNCSAPHQALAPIGLSTVAAGGTFTFDVMANATNSADSFIAVNGFSSAPSDSSFVCDVYIEGEIMIRGSSAADFKMVQVKFGFIGYPAFTPISVNQTTLFAGANNISVVCAVDASNLLTITVPANDGWTVRGLLRITRIPFRVF